MNGCNPRVPEKIPDVERKYMRDLVDAHSGCEPRIVNLHARYRMRHEHIPPLLMYGLTVFKKCELMFDKSRAEVCSGRRKAIPVPRGWACTGIPELSQILGGVTKIGASRPELLDDRTYKRVIGVVRFDKPQQNIRVDQVGRQSDAVLVEAFSGETLGHQKRKFLGALRHCREKALDLLGRSGILRSGRFRARLLD
jgi:hypothetical protein